MNLNPAQDGIDHINIYTKGATELGRFLSNFAHCPIVTEDGPFRTIEGLWYWLIVKDDRLRTTNGFESKKLGRQNSKQDWLEDDESKEKIKRAISIKIESQPRMLKELIKSTLPLTHYYCYGDKVINVPAASWIIEHIESVRASYKTKS